MGMLGVALLVVLAAIAGVSWWLGAVSAAEKPAAPVVPLPPRGNSLSPRQVVVMDVCDDGVFRAS